MSTVIERVRALKPDEKFCSFEFFPPKTDTGFRNLLARLHRMMALNPLFLTVTWGAGGSTSEKSLDLAATCQKALGVTTVLHLTCTNTNKEVIDNALSRAKEAGIRNILALRGDPPRTQEYWTPNCDFKNAIDLVKYIKEQYGDHFCIGVAGYPDGHVDGANETQQSPRKDLPYLIEKVKAGADFIITQLFFDVDKLVAYENMLQSVPELKNVLLIPGLMPITTHRVFVRATKLSHAHVPREIHARLEAYKNDDDMVKSIGIDVVTRIIYDIHCRTKGRVRGFHFYTLNLEKAIAHIIERSPLLNFIDHNQVIDHENAVGSDSDSDSDSDTVGSDSESVSGPDSNKKQFRKVTTRKIRKSLTIEDAQLDVISDDLSKDRKKLIDISSGRGVLGKDATWDEFPNGRFGNSNSPAYGEIDGYGPNLKLQPEQILQTWGTPETPNDISKLFKEYLSGKISVLPWVDTEISSETALIQEELFDLNSRGWFTLASQPAVNACSSSDKILGWGPPKGHIFQKAFIEFFIPKQDWDNKLAPKLRNQIEDKTVTYFRGDCSANISSNLPIGNHQEDHGANRTVVTWGVFPAKEVLQPTIIDYESFKAWNEEAFHLWVEWARCYKKDTTAYHLLSSIYQNYYLVSMTHHDFTDEYGLWNLLSAE